MRLELSILGDTIKLVERLMKEKKSSGRQDFDMWKEVREMKPEVKLDYTEYRNLLEMVGRCAMILERAQVQITDQDFELDPQVEFTPIIDEDCLLDRFLQSDQAFGDLEKSLGLSQN